MDAAAALRRSLEEAHATLARGEAVEAERQAKAISALVRAERETAEFATEVGSKSEEDAETLRAEIRSRILRLAAASGFEPDFGGPDTGRPGAPSQ